MRKNLKQVLALGLVSALVLSGCGASGNDQPKATPKATEEGAKESAAPSAAPSQAPSETQSKTEQLKAELDFGGETITFCYPPGYGMINDGTSPSLTRRDERMAELEKKYNVKIVQKDDASTYWENMVTSIASGSPEGHIMITQEAQLLDWSAAGAIADLAPAMEKTGIDFSDETKYSPVVRKYSNYNGAQYGFAEPAPYVSSNFWYFNKRIFNEMQLGDPYEMVEKGEWTWEKVTELAQKATKKKADGTIEQYGLGSMLLADLLGSLCQSNGTTIASFNADGKAELTLASEKGMKAFQQMSDWLFKDKVALFNDGSLDWDATISNFINGEVAIFCGGGPVINSAKSTPMSDDFGVVPAPKGPDVTEYTIGASMGQFYFIPKTYEAMADKLLLLIDDLYALPEGMTREDMVSESYVGHMRDEESLKYYTDMAMNYNKDVYELASISGLTWSEPSIMAICSMVVKGEATPADVMEQNKVQLQTLLDDKFASMKFTGK